MPDKLLDHRPRGWFWVNNDLVDVFGPFIGASAMGVYTVLARHADAGAKCFPGYERLRKLTKISSHNTLRANLQTLEKYKLISIAGGKTDSGKTTVYTYALLPVEEAKSALSSVSKIDTVDCQKLTHGVSKIDSASIKETHYKELSSSYEEDTPAAQDAAKAAEPAPEKPLMPKPFNYVKAFIDTWRDVFPGEPDPHIPGRYAAALKRLGQEITPERFVPVVRAYLHSDHYQAVQGGHSIKVFCDHPADTWTRGRSPRPPAFRPADAAGSLDEQKDAMRKMRESSMREETQ